MKIKSPFIQNLYKAYTEGVYADTPQNRKLGRVGMTYSQYAKKKYNEDEGGDKERIHEKSYYQEEIKKLAKKAFENGKSEVPFLDEDTKKLVKEAEKDWGLNFSSDICQVWTDTYFKELFKKSVDKTKNSGTSINEELWTKNLFLESGLFEKHFCQTPKWKKTYIPSGCELKDIGEFSVILTKDGDLVGGYHNDNLALYLKSDYKIEEKDNKYYIIKK